jgi:type VI secretion system ImpC/EvpB family protein
MRLLVLGDFSGRPAAERPPLATRPTHQIDLDNIDTVMRRLAPRIAVPSEEIRFETIDDFHPDRLYARLSLFEALRHARANPPADTDATLGRLLGKSSESAATASAAPADPIQSLIHRIVEPYVVKDVPAQSAGYAAAVDTAIAEQMRTLLHQPPFQSLEAAWRGARWLVANLELDERLQLHLFDVARDELLADVVAAEGKLAETALHRALVERWRNVPGAQGWSALIVLMEFGSSVGDVGLLAALGLIAAQAGAPLLAGADRSLSEDAAAETSRWQALRRSEVAPVIALAAPRMLLRLPYGRQTDAIESFGFEELVGPPVHDELLWGTGSLALAMLLGRSFTARGWDMEPGDERDIDDLPAYTFMRDGEPELQACAERYLTERQIQAMIDAGLVPLASRRDRNAIVAVRFQSVADPPAPLRW